MTKLPEDYRSHLEGWREVLLALPILLAAAAIGRPALIVVGIATAIAMAIFAKPRRQDLPLDTQRRLDRFDRVQAWRRRRLEGTWSVHIEPDGWRFAEDGGTQGYSWRVWAAGGEGAPPLEFSASFPDRRRGGSLRRVDGEVLRVDDPYVPEGDWVFEYRVAAGEVRDGEPGELAFGKAELVIAGPELERRESRRYKRLVGECSPWPEPVGEGEGFALPPVEGELCAVCADRLDDRARRCPRCETPHHRDCWSYNQGCAVFGCEPAVAGRSQGAPR